MTWRVAEHDILAVRTYGYEEYDTQEKAIQRAWMIVRRFERVGEVTTSPLMCGGYFYGVGDNRYGARLWEFNLADKKE